MLAVSTQRTAGDAVAQTYCFRKHRSPRHSHIH